MYQVVIVEACPVGGRLATELSSRGISTLMLEEHAEIGRPFQCAGLVNPPAMNMVNLHDTILQSVDGVQEKVRSRCGCTSNGCWSASVAQIEAN